MASADAAATLAALPLRRLILCPLFLVGVLPLRLEAAPVWRELQSAEFTLISQLPERDTRAWATEFEQFIDALRGIIPVDPRQLPPLTVVLFASPKAFAPYRPAGPDGKPIDAAGFFSRQAGWAMIGLANRFDDEGTRQVIFHEGVHWCMSQTAADYPLWLNEGLAEVFSTFRIEDGNARWGDPLLRHVALLRSVTPLPVEKLMTITRSDPLYYQRHRIGIYYAESWAFVHYLLFGGRAGSRTDLSYYLEERRTGMAPDKAFEVAFGTDYSGMDDNLSAYVRTGSYAAALKPLADTPAAAMEFSVAPPRLVEITLEKLALCAGRQGLARQHAAAAARLGP